MTRSILLISASLSAAAPVPPCPAPFASAAVPETWCSSVIASSASGVIVAQYGEPANETLVTVPSSASVWYEEALFFLGGGIANVFNFLAGENVAKEDIIGRARTVPFIIRPLSPAATPPGSWMTSMMISTAAFPAVDAIPLPTAAGTRLEAVGTHTFATLAFNFTNAVGSVYPLPPYFTYFLRCDAELAAGLPAGWELVPDSVWTPSWLIYNGQGWNKTWTSQCLAEVQAAPTPALAPPLPPVKAAAPLAAPAAPLPALPPRAVVRGSATPPPLCAIMLEFETVYWGAWALPHAPNVALPDINGGSDGFAAMDYASGTAFLATVADTPFFTLRLVAIDTATGATRTIGNNWPLAPAGFSGVSGLFQTLDHDPALGLVICMTEISKYGPIPAQTSEPGLPVGWTVVASVDPATAASTALTADLSPALAAFPPVVPGLSALDGARAALWLLGADATVSPIGLTSAAQQQQQQRRRRWPAPAQSAAAAAAAAGGGAVFLGIALASAPAPVAPPPASIAAVGGGFIVCAFVYAAAADALVALEFNATTTGGRPPSWFSLPLGIVRAYPVNGSAPYILGSIPAGTVSPSVGQAVVSADGHFAYFGAAQGSAEFESAALITVDVVARTLDIALAAPSDDYDCLGLYRCA